MTSLALIAFLAAQTFANATVVSTDVPRHKLTITRNGGPHEVLAVASAAAARLAELKPGDEVILTLRGAEGAPPVVATIERSLRGTRPARRFKPGAAPGSPSPPSPSVPPGRAKRASPSPVPPTSRPPTDTVGPLQDPRKGAQQDPRDNPNRDLRVVPGLTEPPPGAKPSPTPTPTPKP